jgi:predicted alpha/beta-fold hydrolase
VSQELSEETNEGAAEPKPGETTEITAAWWVPGGHLQTTWGRFGRSGRLLNFERELLPTADGDHLVLDHLAGPADAPRVILLHGLEGSSFAVYMLGLARLIARAGWRATAVNFRSCARDPQRVGRWLPTRRPRLYHSGDTGDLDLVVGTLASREPKATLYAVGVSLGGNVLLKWLGETGPRAKIDAAATISVPYDLHASSTYLERGASRIYTAYFLRTLKQKMFDVLARFPEETKGLDREQIRQAQTFRTFDEAATAPLHGFYSADDYYLRASSMRYLHRIEVPTLCVNSADDPFVPTESVTRARSAASEDVAFRVTRRGGHAAFISGRWPWRPRYWAEEQTIAWLAGKPV